MSDEHGGDRYETLQVHVDRHVAVAVIDAPPVNVMTASLFRDLRHFGDRVAGDDDVRVVVLRSAEPDFFIAHFDVESILEMSADEPPVRSSELNRFHQMCETYRTMPKATICEIAGRVGGGGNELAMSCDMRFGAIGQTVINQMEVPLGILPGGTGTQRLPRLVGRGRAMEIILGGVDIDAETAERWGLLNRALPADELRGHVDVLARRIAGFPPGAVRLAKRSVLNAEDLELHDGLLEESFLFQQTLRLPGTRAAMHTFLERGGQTREGERRVGELMSDPEPS